MNNKAVIPLLSATLFVFASAPSASAKGQKRDKHEAKIEKRDDKLVKQLEKRDAKLYKDADKRDAKRSKDARKRDAKPRMYTARSYTAPADTARARRRERDAVVFDRDGHRRIVSEYYNREGLPPGLARRESLPPGLARQLRERGTLPPGLQRRLIPVPQPLLGRLPAVSPHYRRYFAGRDLVVVDRRTNRIIDVVPDVLPRYR